jgi:hypothetical protein
MWLALWLSACILPIADAPDADGDGLYLDQDCDDADPAVGAAGTLYEDADGDGFGATEVAGCPAPGLVADGSDCDDADADVFPGADERCDGVDQDCDTVPDDDAVDFQAFYADTDGDGYGDPAAREDACAAPAGYVADGTDCDDTDDAAFPGAPTTQCDAADRNCDGIADDFDGDGDGLAVCAGDCDDGDDAIGPGAIEICDSRDDDCDGAIDEDAVGAPTWYADADGDGYGDPATAHHACEASAGDVAVGTDCADDDAAVQVPTWYPDVDGDGYGAPGQGVDACTAPTDYLADGTDCDDQDALAFPGSVETCDPGDDDCDGSADEGPPADAPIWFADLDDDGLGDDSASAPDCSQPAHASAVGGDCDDTDDTVGGKVYLYADADGDGWANGFVYQFTCPIAGYIGLTVPLDCDDGDASVSPDAAETCDGTDDNCSGNENDASDAQTWYRDADGDTYGSTADVLVRCTQPGGYIARGGDCDDAAAIAHPGGAETCDNANLDEDCDGFADDLDPDDANGKTTYYPDNDVDGYGYEDFTGISRRSCEGQPTSGTWSLNALDCEDGVATVHPGVAEVCGNAYDDDCDGDGTACQPSGTDAYDATVTAVSGRPMTALAVADVFGTSEADLVVGDATGRVYVWEGPIAGDVDGTAVDATLVGAAVSDLGVSAAVAGIDLNLDGHGDLAYSLGTADGGGADSGVVYVIYGPIAGNLNVAAATQIVGVAAGDGLGDVGATGGHPLAMSADLTADNHPDLVIGAAGVSTGDGAVYVFDGYAIPSGSQSASTADFTIAGAAGDGAGSAVAAIGDGDDDGYADLVIGAGAANRAYVVRGPITADLDLATDYDAMLTAINGHSGVGAEVSGPGDLDGDSLPDIVIGETGPAFDVFVVAGDVSGTVALGTVSRFTGGGSGRTVYGAADIDGDHRPDLVVGDVPDGAAAVWFGALGFGTRDATTTASWYRSGLGSAVLGVGDLDGDGKDDLLGVDPTDSTLLRVGYGVGW